MKKFFSYPPVSFVLESAELYLRVGVPRSAAALSYFLILTLFPLLVCVNYFIGLFHLNLEQLLVSLDQLLPQGVLVLFRDYLTYIDTNQSSAMLLSGAFLTVLFASAAVRAFSTS